MSVRFSGRWWTGAWLVLALPVQAAEWRLQAGVDARWFDWREYLDGRQLLMERGPLATASLGGELAEGGWFLRGDALWGGGPARYDGHLQTGEPYEANAGEEILESRLRAGWRGARLEVSAALLQRDWRRYIEGSATVSSAEERYRWRIAVVGAALALPARQPARLALDIGAPFDSYQKVYSGFYDDFSLEPGDGVYWRLSAPFALPGDGRLQLEPWYQEQYMDASDPVPLTRDGVPQNLQAFQPESVRRELGLTLRLLLGGSEAASAP